jgi:hypothetical protein
LAGGDTAALALAAAPAAAAAAAPAAAAATRLEAVEAAAWALLRFVLDPRFPVAGGGAGGGGGVLRAFDDGRPALARFAADARFGLAVRDFAALDFAAVDFAAVDFAGLDFAEADFAALVFAGPAELTRDARGLAVSFRPGLFLVAMIEGRSAPLIPCLFLARSLAP